MKKKDIEQKNDKPKQKQEINNQGKNGYYKLYFTIIGSMIGVGFITGAEIYQFFARFGIGGFIGAIIFAVMTYWLVKSILLEYSNDAGNEIDLKNNLYGDKEFKKKCIRLVVVKEIILSINYVIVSAAMIAGLREIIYSIFSYNKIIIYIVCLMVLFIILYRGIDSFSRFNFITVLCVIYIVILVLFFTKTDKILYINYENITLQMLIFSGVSAFIYIFMNILEIRPAVNELKLKFTKKSASIFSFFIVLFLYVLITIISYVLIINYKINNASMPFLILFKNKSKFFEIFYIISLLFALLSTCLACLFGVKNKVQQKLLKLPITGTDICFSKNCEICEIADKRFTDVKPKILDKLKTKCAGESGVINLISCFLTLILATAIGIFPFSFFVKYAYPIVGICNFVVFMFDLLLKNNKQNLKNC